MRRIFFLFVSMLLPVAVAHCAQPELKLYTIVMTDGSVMRGDVIVRSERVTISHPDGRLYQLPIPLVHRIVDEASKPTLIGEDTLLRTQPQSAADAVDRLPRGLPVRIEGATGEQGWVSVRTSLGKQGWISTGALTNNVMFTPLPAGTVLAWPVEFSTQRDKVTLMGFEQPKQWAHGYSPEDFPALFGNRDETPFTPGGETSFSQN